MYVQLCLKIKTVTLLSPLKISMDDQIFTDVVFSLKANPEITNVPPVDEDLNTTIEKTGVYAFEDEWPKAGDYDMNDVLVQYTYQKKYSIYSMKS